MQNTSTPSPQTDLPVDQAGITGHAPSKIKLLRNADTKPGQHKHKYQGNITQHMAKTMQM